jgi:hypothetical protein
MTERKEATYKSSKWESLWKVPSSIRVILLSVNALPREWSLDDSTTQTMSMVGSLQVFQPHRIIEDARCKFLQLIGNECSCFTNIVRADSQSRALTESSTLLSRAPYKDSRFCSPWKLPLWSLDSRLLERSLQLYPRKLSWSVLSKQDQLKCSFHTLLWFEIWVDFLLVVSILSISSNYSAIIWE